MIFTPVTINDKNILVPYLFRYGANSCQHSFTQMVGLFAKYGDEYCVMDNILYIHRSKLDTEDKRVYLAPFGNTEDCLKECIDNLFKDAHSYGKKLVFESLTKDFVRELKAVCEDKFVYSNNRDLAEYIYSTDTMISLSGGRLDGKRNHINTFHANYPNAVIEKISAANICDAKSYQLEWLADRNCYEADEKLDMENDSISIYLDNYEYFDFDGIIIYIDGKVAGFCAGVPLSDNCMDEVIEKGDRNYSGIYQVLCQQFAKMCCNGYEYINREEDLGIPGLRKAKKSYQPAILLDKYVVWEK